MNPADDIWAKVIELMKQQGLSPTTIKTWFDDAKAVSLTEDSFTISTPNDYTQSVIKSLYIPKIEAALKELFSMDLKVVVLTEKELENTSAAKQDILFPGTSDYTFERFVVGSSNRYAYSAARRWPIFRAGRATTRCLSTANPDWARPIYSTPSPTPSTPTIQTIRSSTSRGTPLPTSW